MASDVFGRNKECVVARISGGDPHGVHEAGACLGGGRALHPRGKVVGPPGVFFVP